MPSVLAKVPGGQASQIAPLEVFPAAHGVHSSITAPGSDIRPAGQASQASSNVIDDSLSLFPAPCRAFHAVFLIGGVHGAPVSSQWAVLAFRRTGISKCPDRAWCAPKAVFEAPKGTVHAGGGACGLRNFSRGTRQAVRRTLAFALHVVPPRGTGLALRVSRRVRECSERTRLTRLPAAVLPSGAVIARNGLVGIGKHSSRTGKAVVPTSTRKRPNDARLAASAGPAGCAPVGWGHDQERGLKVVVVGVGTAKQPAPEEGSTRSRG